MSRSKPVRWRLEQLDEVTSTQDLLRERLEQGRDVTGLVLRARSQVAGRGRGSRDWLSPAGGSWQSVGIGPGQFEPNPAIALWIAVGIAEALNLAGAGVGLKWPNDLILASSKAGGILVESVRGHLLIGVGVNVCNEPPAGFSALGYIGLQKVEFSVLEGIEAGIGLACDREASLPARYARLDCLAKREVRVTRGDETLDGTASGVDASGRLLLVQAGRTIAIETGSVRLRRSDH